MSGQMQSDRSNTPPTPIVYCVTPDIAALMIDTARELGAPLRKGARSGEAWQLAVGFVLGKARAAGHRNMADLP
jgi:hypothetical protein